MVCLVLAMVNSLLKIHNLRESLEALNRTYYSKSKRIIKNLVKVLMMAVLQIVMGNQQTGTALKRKLKIKNNLRKNQLVSLKVFLQN